MPTGVSFSQLCDLAAEYGRMRSAQGDVFGINKSMPPGIYYHVFAGTLTTVQVWGSEERPSLSVYSCARAGMLPTMDLYRYVSLWRSTSGFAAPYVIELKGRAAVMCEREISGANYNDDDVLARHVAVTIDVVGEASRIISNDLAGADGARLEDSGLDLEDTQFQLWLHWQVSDSRMSKLAGIQ